MKYNLLIISVLFAIYSCKNINSTGQASTQLPYYGNHQIAGGDTSRYRIPAFEMVDQDSQLITNASFKGKIYITDFFFTSCQTICPKVKKQMLRIYERYADEERLALLSHSIDTKRDTVPKLKKYAAQLEVESGRWHFVTGKRDHIYEMADAYFITAQEDPSAPGGFDHSGKIILVDGDGHVRGHADGTDEASVTKFFKTIDQLLDEQN